MHLDLSINPRSIWCNSWIAESYFRYNLRPISIQFGLNLKTFRDSYEANRNQETEWGRAGADGQSLEAMMGAWQANSDPRIDSSVALRLPPRTHILAESP